MLRRLVWHWLVLILGIYVLTLIPFLGITCQPRSDLMWAAFFLLVANTIFRPILLFFTFPLILLTLGLFILVINALVLDWIPHFVPGLHIPNFGSAFLGAILLSLITWIFLGFRRGGRAWRSGQARQQAVIDI